ncbi:MAG: trypsin-like peptidase domain-containing protein [Candidatus Paracaedibacteraceae bacterium]|nr:trypsin-like peptidase domain-containing protein [Candidatus Paracaedibacteraceae bacterium]
MKKKTPESQFESAIKRKIEGYIPQVFKVICDNKNGGHTGTAFMFNAERGILATNHHVMNPDYGLYTIEDEHGNKFRKKQVKLVGLSPSTQYGDFGFIQVEELAGKFQQIPMVNEHRINMHDPVAFMGNSYGEFSVEEGNINGHYDFCMIKLIESFQVQLMSRGGASGSPTFNKNGELIGILYAGDDIHSVVHPIWFLQRAYNIMIQEPFPRPVSFKSFHCIYDTINADDICNYYGVTRTEIDPYLIDHAKTRQSLLCLMGNYKAKDSDAIHDGDVLLTVSGQKIGCNTIKITELLDAAKGAVEIEVLRVGKIIKLSVVPEIAVQSYSKRMILDDITIYSNSASFYLKKYKKDAPILVSDENGVMGTKKHNVFELETEDHFNGVISKIGDQEVHTFDEFLCVFYKTYIQDGNEYLIFTTENEHGEMFETHHIDLTTLANLEPEITFFNNEERCWNKLHLSNYLHLNNFLND